MLKFVFLLCLAVAAMAVDVNEELKEQVIRIGSVGIKFADLQGYLVRNTEFVDIPTFEFRGVKDVIKDKDLLTFRCNILNNFYLAHETTNKPVLLCRDYNVERVVTNDNVVFLFSAENLPVPLGVSEIDLMLGKSLWTNLLSGTDVNKFVATTTTVNDRVKSLYRNVDGEPLMLRQKRQFGGGGFSGSGAQAGASSFGSGFGGGGFPGGFGGGMSGSQAQAGASSFGGGSGFFG